MEGGPRPPSPPPPLATPLINRPTSGATFVSKNASAICLDSSSTGGNAIEESSYNSSRYVALPILSQTHAGLVLLWRFCAILYKQERISVCCQKHFSCDTKRRTCTAIICRSCRRGKMSGAVTQRHLFDYTATGILGEKRETMLQNQLHLRVSVNTVICKLQ